MEKQKNDGTSSTYSFTYWGEDDTNEETGVDWYTLGANESVTLVSNRVSGGIYYNTLELEF